MDGKRKGRGEGYAYIYGTYQYVALNKDSVNIFVYSFYCCCAVLSHVQLCDPMDYSLPDSSVLEVCSQEYWSGGLSLLQGIFLTQKLNQGLLHCKQILYQLSYLGNREPRNTSHMKKASENRIKTKTSR